MKITKIIHGFFVFCIVVLEAQPLKVKVSAKAAIVYNPENGAVLFEKQAREPHYPASILKIATAYFALDEKKVDMEDGCLVTEDILRTMRAETKQADPTLYPAHILEHDGVMMGLKEGRAYPLKDLLHGLLLVSGNDAANAIAKHCSGTVTKFMEEMNQFLKGKGVFQTRFQNPHGLHHPAQMTTAYDMAVIAGFAFQNERFLEIVRKASFDLEDGAKIKNTNRLLKEGKYFYPKFIGGKTGYTFKAGYNLVAAAEDNGRKLIIVLLGCESRTKRFEDAISLFETAFREKPKKRTVFSKDHEPFTKQINNGNRSLRARIDQDIVISFYPSEEPTPCANLVWKKLSLPIELGQEVGKLEVKDERGNCIGFAPLYADIEVNKKRSLAWIWWSLGIGFSMGLYLLKKRSKITER